MDNKIRQIFEKFVKIRLSHLDKEDPYYKEWEERFEKGMEWQNSDYSNRRILKSIASDIYPDDKDTFFIRE